MHKYSPTTQIVSKPHGNVMENSITPYCGTMWQGNTIPMCWSTFQVQT